LGKPFDVLPFQRDIIEKIYSVDDEGKRVVRTAVIGLPRKNAKSTLVAALCVYGLIADTSDASPVVIAAAGDRQQARLVHDEIKRMILASEELSSVCVVQRNEIRCTLNNGVCRVVSADAGLQQGLNPSLVVVDEYHVHKNSELFDALTLGSATRNQPLSLVISTAGWDLESPLGQLYRYGRKVESGEIDDPSFAFVWHGPDDNVEYDVSDREVWEECNPAWDHFLNHDDFESTFKRTPAAAFTRYRLNGWTATANHWLPTGVFESCAAERRLETGERIILGFDGAWMSDSTALVAVTLDDEGPRHLEVIGCWEKPDDQHAQGWRTPIHEVEQLIRESFEKYSVAVLLADPWRWEQTLQALADEGYPVVEFPTGSVQRMTQATQAMYDAIIDGNLTHNGDPQLLRHFLNCHLKEDARGARIMKDHRGSSKKIDLAVASIMAHHQALTWRDDTSAEPQMLVL
tara:strand:+ start:2499 stop:3881 length:1383 start_codon:yes stop_codon:yes gene_type:complete